MNENVLGNQADTAEPQQSVDPIVLKLTKRTLGMRIGLPLTSRYSLASVIIRPDGSVESTDGKALLRIQGDSGMGKPPSVVCLSAAAAQKAYSEMKQKKGHDFRALLDVSAETLSYTDKRDNRVVLEKVLESAVKAPPTDDVFENFVAKPCPNTVTLNARQLGKTLDALKRVGAENITIEFTASDQGVRLSAVAEVDGVARRVCGVLMPIHMPSPLRPEWNPDCSSPEER